jgi:hypothetical protein
VFVVVFVRLTLSHCCLSFLLIVGRGDFWRDGAHGCAVGEYSMWRVDGAIISIYINISMLNFSIACDVNFTLLALLLRRLRRHYR